MQPYSNYILRIGIDISQIAHEGTGVAEYTKNLVKKLLEIDKKNEYILFYSSLRKRITNYELRITNYENITLKKYRFPPILLDLLWNRLHIFPIELLIGDVDIFLSSDWVQPPSRKAKMVTVVHDLIALKYPQETHPRAEFNWKKLLFSPNVVETQKRRLRWVKKECDVIICDSRATKSDIIQMLGIEESKIHIIYPGANK